MKTIKITYWISTGLVSLLYAFDAFMFLSQNPRMVGSLQSLGYPAYLLSMLGVAKSLAAIGIVVPKMPRLKEWVYAGIYINMIGAIWSHAAMGQTDQILPGAIVIVFVTVSYITYRKLQPTNITA